MARKGENIYKRKDGRWEGRYRRENAPDGRKRYGSVYGRTYREVKEKLVLKKREQLTEQDNCGRLPAGYTMGEAARLWLEERKSGWKESTFATYRSIVEKHILPGVGSQQIKAWDTVLCQKYFKTLREGNKGKGLSANYLHQIGIIIDQILQLVEEKYQCGRLEHPHTSSVPKHRTIKTPPDADIRKLEEYLQSEALNGDVTCMGILLTGCSGIRIGELCALRWEDIRFDKGTMHIGKTLQRIRTFRDNNPEEDGHPRTGTKITITTPKSLNSDREIPLPAYLLCILQRRKGNKNGYLLPGKKKEYTEPRTLQYRFRKILDTLGLPSFNFHMLRHIFATNCISHGFDMKTVSELLGHSNVTTTMHIYVHSDMERKKMLMADYHMTA